MTLTPKLNIQECDKEIQILLGSSPGDANLVKAYRSLLIPSDNDRFIEFTGFSKTGNKFTVTHQKALPDYLLACHLGLFKHGEDNISKEKLNTLKGRDYTCQLPSWTVDGKPHQTRGSYYAPRKGEVFKIGAQLSSKQGMTKTVMLDLDVQRYYNLVGVKIPRGDHPQAIRDAKVKAKMQVAPYMRADAEKIISSLELHGLVPYLEWSTSGGLHLWLFFSEPVPVAKVQAFFKQLLKPLDIPEVEVYPKASSEHSNNCYLPVEIINPDGVVIPLNDAEYDFTEDTKDSPSEAINSTQGVTTAKSRSKAISKPLSTLDKTGVYEALRAYILNPPETFQRHEAVPAFINLAERHGFQKDILELLSSQEVFEAWGLAGDGTRTLSQWQHEVLGWSQQDPPIDDQGNEFRRGIPFLKSLGFDVSGIKVQTSSVAEDNELAIIPYVEKNNTLHFRKKIKVEDETVNQDTPLCNFTARIIEQISLDDGVEVKRRLLIGGTLNKGKTLPAVEISTSQFNNFSWLVDQWGAEAVLGAGQATRDKLRHAIQLYSIHDGIKHTASYQHLGWRLIEGEWHYLFNGGAVNAKGITQDINVQAGDALKHYVLEVATDTQEAIRASMDFLQLAPLSVTLPLYLSIYRSVIATADFTPYIAGRTGTRKSALAAIAISHFGRVMCDGRHFPADWTATANALEGIAFFAKDALLVIDDFAPQGDQRQAREYHSKASRVLRAQGNNSGRGRMRADETIKPQKPPRGLILSTGEDLPTGHSIRARSLILELEKEAVDLSKLSKMQELAAEGLLAGALTAFITWLAPRLDDVRQKLKASLAYYRPHFEAGHGRTADACCELMFTCDVFTVFLEEQGFKPDDLRSQAFEVLQTVAGQQADHQKDQDHTLQFINLIQSALASGKAHLTDLEGRRPIDPALYGWREDETSQGLVWRPLGVKIGWLSDDANMYLEPTASYSTAQNIAKEGGGVLATTPRTLWKRLDEVGLIQSKTKGRNTLKITTEGSRRNVIHLVNALKNLAPSPSEKRDNRDSPTKHREARAYNCPDNFFRPDKNGTLPQGIKKPSGYCPDKNGTVEKNGTAILESQTEEQLPVPIVPISARVGVQGSEGTDVWEMEL